MALREDYCSLKDSPNQYTLRFLFLFFFFFKFWVNFAQKKGKPTCCVGRWYTHIFSWCSLPWSYSWIPDTARRTRHTDRQAQSVERQTVNLMVRVPYWAQLFLFFNFFSSLFLLLKQTDKTLYTNTHIRNKLSLAPIISSFIISNVVSTVHQVLLFFFPYLFLFLFRYVAFFSLGAW